MTKVFSSTLTSETTFGLTFINFPNRLEDPSKVERRRWVHEPGIYRNGLTNSVVGHLGRLSTLFNPGGFDPELFAKKWLISISQNVTKVAGAHTLKGGFFYEWVNNNQPGTATATPSSSRRAGPAVRPATPLRTCSRAA